MRQLYIAGIAVSAITFAAGWPFAASYAAGPLPAAANAASYREVGEVGSVDLAYDSILVNDRGYRIAPGVPVHTPQGMASRNVLRSGLRVGFNSVDGGPRPVITEVWLLERR